MTLPEHLGFIEYTRSLPPKPAKLREIFSFEQIAGCATRVRRSF